MARLDRLPRLLVAGHVNVDRLLRVRRFPEPDRTVPVLAEREELGGTATNLARVARRLGVPVGILARVGDGFPSRFRRELRDEGIDLRGLQEVRGLPTPCCTIVETPEGTSRTFIQQGPMEGAHAGELPGPWWRGYRWVHLGTGAPERTVRLARAAHAENRRVALDPAQEIFYRWDRERFRSVLPYADLLFGNRAEIARAAGLLGGGSPARLLEKVPLVVRTEGPRGASAFFRGGHVHVPTRAPSRRRTLVGAGDAFRGGFYATWFAGEPLAACLAAANGAARGWIEGRS